MYILNIVSGCDFVFNIMHFLPECNETCTTCLDEKSCTSCNSDLHLADGTCYGEWELVMGVSLFSGNNLRGSRSTVATCWTAVSMYRLYN